MDVKKLKMHLDAAMACLEGMEGEHDGSAPEGDDDGDDMAMKSMKMKLSKYKE